MNKPLRTDGLIIAGCRLEREVWTLEEISRALHLQAGFNTFQDLWPLSVTHAAFMISCFHKTPGSDKTRYELANRSAWAGRNILLGQLVYVRDVKQQKFLQAIVLTPVLTIQGCIWC